MQDIRVNISIKYFGGCKEAAVKKIQKLHFVFLVGQLQATGF